jgi:hypothetical protein
MDHRDFSYEQKNSFKNTNSNTWDASHPPDDHFIHAKVLGEYKKLSEKRHGQEIC